jgi:quercetin dioxygenase-like cupin family protein
VESKSSTKKKGKIMNSLTHLNKLRTLPLLIAPALIALVASAPTPAFATPSCGTTNTNLLAPVSAGYFPDGLLDLMCKQLGWDLKTKVKGDSDLYVTLVTFQPGGQTGWHSHPGPSLITVIEGALTVYHDDCTFETYSAGQSFTDLGCGDIHNVVNATGMEAKDVAVQLVPHGAARRDDKPSPGCAQPAPCP